MLAPDFCILPADSRFGNVGHCLAVPVLIVSVGSSWHRGP